MRWTRWFVASDSDPGTHIAESVLAGADIVKSLFMTMVAGAPTSISLFEIRKVLKSLW
jgi:hypothetical protein